MMAHPDFRSIPVLIILNAALRIMHSILESVPFIGRLFSLGLALVVGLASLVLWLALMYAAYRRQEWELPWIGQEARKLLNEGSVAAE